MEASNEEMTFLDLKISKGDRFKAKGKLDVCLHVKETNPRCFLHFSSCHPFQTFRTILRGEITRALRCTSSPSLFISIMEKLLGKFRQRGYPTWLIREEADRVHHNQRESLLHPNPKRSLEEDVALFSVTYSKGLSSHRVRRALEDTETPFCPMVLRPRPISTKDRLVRARVPPGGGGRTQVDCQTRPPTTSHPPTTQPNSPSLLFTANETS